MSTCIPTLLLLQSLTCASRQRKTLRNSNLRLMRGAKTLEKESHWNSCRSVFLSVQLSVYVCLSCCPSFLCLCLAACVISMSACFVYDCLSIFVFAWHSALGNLSVSPQNIITEYYFSFSYRRTPFRQWPQLPQMTPGGVPSLEPSRKCKTLYLIDLWHHNSSSCCFNPLRITWLHHLNLASHILSVTLLSDDLIPLNPFLILQWDSKYPPQHSDFSYFQCQCPGLCSIHQHQSNHCHCVVHMLLLCLITIIVHKTNKFISAFLPNVWSNCL